MPSSGIVVILRIINVGDPVLPNTLVFGPWHGGGVDGDLRLTAGVQALGLGELIITGEDESVIFKKLLNL
jgi:hypothetical protein